MRPIKISSVPNFPRHLRLILIALLLLALPFLPMTTLAMEPMLSTEAKPTSQLLPPALERVAPLNAVGDSIPRIHCPVGYTAKVYAEGLSSPDGLAFSPSGILYVAEETAGRVSRIQPDGSATPAISGLTNPEGITFDSDGNLYVVEDVQGGRLVKMATDGSTSTLASGLAAPEGVVWTPDGTLYVTESNAQFASFPPDLPQTHVTAISPLGVVTRILTDTQYSYAGITRGSDGLLYVTNEMSGVEVMGFVTHESVFAVDLTSPATRTLFSSNMVTPEGLRFGAGEGFPLYVAEEDTDGTAGQQGRLSRIEANGSHMPFCTGFYGIEDVVLDEDGRLFVSEDSSNSIIVVEPRLSSKAHAQAIILFIGDGMGEAHRTAARWSAVGRNGALAMDMMPTVGWSSTASANEPITDSAAGSTAIATGVKTNNGMVSQDPEGNPLTTILERAQARGMAVGLITTIQMAHATPAAFSAHVPDRNMMTEIASQMVLTTEVDVLLGGGENEFLPTSTLGCFGLGGRSDDQNLITLAEAADYTHICNAASLAAVNPTSTTRLLGLFANGEMSRPFSPSLADMTEKAIDVLSQDPDGFFLMVEGGLIDRASHANDTSLVISDVLGFDEAVAVAQTYATTAPDTLIIVTADHEAGGMSVGLVASGQDPFYMPDGTPFYVNWTAIEHTSADVPNTSQGPWSTLLAGTHENTYVHEVMRAALESSPNIISTKTALPSDGSWVAPGDLITYTITLTNNGTADATGLVLTDTLSAGISYIPGSASATPGFSIAATSPAMVVIGTLAAGNTMTTTFCVKVTTSLTTTITNTIRLVSNSTDMQSSNSVSHLVQGTGEHSIHLPVIFKGYTD